MHTNTRRNDVARTIDAHITDTPYNFARRLGATEVELQYGNSATYERWRLAALPNITQSSLRVKVNGRWYRFAGTMPKNRAAVSLGRRGGKATSDAKATAARANGKRGGRPRKTAK